MTGQVEQRKTAALFFSNPFPGPILHDFEKRSIIVKAKEKGITPDIGRDVFFFDCKSRTWIVLFWKIRGQPCPFLFNKKCLIYKGRPLQCKHWPLDKEHDITRVAYNCSALQDKLLKTKLEQDKKFFIRFFWQQLISLEQATSFIAGSSDYIEFLESRNLIEIGRNMTEKEIEKKYAPTKILGFCDFIDTIEGQSSKELISSFKNRFSKTEIEKMLNHQINKY